MATDVPGQAGVCFSLMKRDFSFASSIISAAGYCFAVASLIVYVLITLFHC